MLKLVVLTAAFAFPLIAQSTKEDQKTNDFKQAVKILMDDKASVAKIGLRKPFTPIPIRHIHDESIGFCGKNNCVLLMFQWTEKDSGGSFSVNFALEQAVVDITEQKVIKVSLPASLSKEVASNDSKK